MNVPRRLVWPAAFLLTILAANYAVKHWSPVTVWPGIQAPAGVLFAGLAFTLRDKAQDAVGFVGVVLTILTGCLLSYWVSSGRLAAASAAAFGLSETADLLVFTPLRERSWLGALVLSNTVGLVGWRP